MSFTTRRVVRRLAHRNIDWSAPYLKSNPEAASAVSAFRAWVASADAMAEKYSSAPTPIDFKKYESTTRDKAVVDNLKSFYQTFKPEPEVHEWSTEERADKANQIEEAKERLTLTQEMLKDTENEMEFLQSNRTTLDTDGFNVKDAYPDIAEETEKEIEERKWFKDAIAW